MKIHNFIFCFLVTFFSSLQVAANQVPLVSTESDPDAFIHNCVNVITGDYCEAATDLLITGPDSLILQRFYSNRDSITGTQSGGWKIFPERFLVIGKDPSKKFCTVGKDRFDFSTAFVGERSGGILPYSGWRNANGQSKDPFKIDIWNQAPGTVNTYAKEMNGQNNHKNNLLYCKGNTCELTLGDGSKRIYEKVSSLPSAILGEEMTPLMASQMIEADYFHLVQENLPSGNKLFFSYDSEGHLIAVEMKNITSHKIFSWLHFSYEFKEKGCVVTIETSDARELHYHFVLADKNYRLTHVSGSHCMPTSYEYEGELIRKNLPEGRFIEAEYSEGKVVALKRPNALSGKEEILHSFSYGDGYTDVFDAMGIKTRYIYDAYFQLKMIEQYDDHHNLYRIETRFWGNNKSEAGLLMAKSIGDGKRTHSFRSFQYDKSYNVIEEKLYGNLTGKEEVSLQISSEGKILNPDAEECHMKTFGYSTDGFNLLTRVGDCKGNQTLYTYKPGTNLLTRKLIYGKGFIQKRTFYFYNEDNICVRTIEDDGSEEGEDDLSEITERHIQKITPKETLPGVGLPEVTEEKAFDLKNKQEILIKKFVNQYDNQSNLLSCSTYDSNGQYAFTEKRTYLPTGQIASQIDAIGREVMYEYDALGNQISRFIPHENREIKTKYDFHNQPIQIMEMNPEEEFSLFNAYDILGRKTGSRDRFGNTTLYEYDSFHRLTKVIHPETVNEYNKIIRPTFYYTYDIFGNIITITDPIGSVTCKSFNLRGDPTKISYPDGTFELFKYDAEGSLHRSLTRDQIITVYEYDYLGRSVYEESSTAGETGVSSFLISRSRQYNGFRCIYEKEDSFIKRYSFDPAGRLSSTIQYGSGQNENSPDTRKTEFIYDAFGRIQQRRVWFDTGPFDYSVECLEYDLSGNILQKRIEDAGQNILLQKYFSYNLQDQCVEEYNLENNVKTILVKTDYNSQGEPVAYFDGLNQETRILIDNKYQNSLGQTVLKKTVINPIGVQTEIEFDTLGRISSISKKDPFGILLSSQKTLYDYLGNKSCEIQDQVVNGEIVASQKTMRRYGSMGQLKEELIEPESPIAKYTRYEYNSLGKLVCKAMPDASVSIQYTYNKDGNLHKIESQNNKKELQISNTYSYDRKGNILSANSLQGKSIQKTYNAFNQVTKETIKDGEGSYTILYAYDRKGRLKEITLPDESKIAYTYDAVFGREVSRISDQGKILYSHIYDNYNTLGQLLNEEHLGYVGAQKYSYNLNGQKIESQNDFFREEYTRDLLGSIVEVKGDNPQQYTYNNLSQLTYEKKIQEKAYSYDSLDNRIKTDNEELIYNTLNQLVSYSDVKFSYDPEGNLLKKVLDGEETSFENNVLSQLTAIKKADQTAITFSYDPYGRVLVEKHLNTKGKNKKTLSTTRYLYLGYQEIGTISQKGVIETLKIPGLQGDELAPTCIAIEIKGEVYVPLHDVAGNVIKLIDPQSREIVESYEYTAFGEESIFNEAGGKEEVSIMGNPWRFAEKRVDENSGLILFGLRFYDPTIGRWISPDPAGIIDGPNLYSYLHNNQVNSFDRFGLATEANSENKFAGYFYGEVESHCYCEKHRTCKRGGDIGKTSAASLPTITYNDYFEKFYKNYYSRDIFIKDYYNNSSCYDLDGTLNLPNGLGIGFINGIWNDFEDAKASAQYLSTLSGGYNIHGVYNATHGKKIDPVECGMGLNYIATEPVRQLHKMWNSFFEKSSANTKFLMICHSQGAIHVRNALLDYPPELRDRILVVGIAPAGYIYKETCADLFHYRAKPWRDFVPRIDRAGAKREKNSIVELDSDPKASIFDHEFMSPTYQKVLRKHITNYITSNGKIL